MEQATEAFAAITCLVLGLSHVVQPLGWVEFFIWLREKGHSGVFVNGFLSLGFGSVIVAFHNVWTGLPAVLTVLGWAQVLRVCCCSSRRRLACEASSESRRNEPGSSWGPAASYWR